MSRDELIREALRALHACTEADKPLSPDNVVIGVVGEGSPFTIIEGDAAAPFLVAVEGLPRPAQAAAPVEADGNVDDSAVPVAPGGAAAAADNSPAAMVDGE